MEEIYLKINGCEYYVQDSRNGHDCVILLHGWPDDSSLWRFQIPALVQSGYRVICLDWLGHGQSEKTKDLNLIKVPTLGIWSSGDNFMAEEQMKKSGTLVQSEWQYLQISKCNHWLQLEKPQEINKRLLEWLDKHLAGGQ